MINYFSGLCKGVGFAEALATKLKENSLWLLL
jgi:hypothetical protein